MTLEEYKSQCKAIKEETENFKGTQEETIKFLEDLATKYPEVNEFNTKALECKDVTEFKQLADSVGMKFSNEDSAKKLYSLLINKKTLLNLTTKRLENGAELSDNDLTYVYGGKPVVDNQAKIKNGKVKLQKPIKKVIKKRHLSFEVHPKV